MLNAFFSFWEYSGLDGVNDREENEIAQAMRIEKASIIQSLHDCGNVCLSHKDEICSSQNFFICILIEIPEKKNLFMNAILGLVKISGNSN